MAARRAALARLAPALGACVAMAALAVPAASAIDAARRHASDAGLASRLSAAQVTALSRYLTAHDRGARYETASASADRAAPLIVRDGRPVLMLTSLHGRPLLGARTLARLVARGRVRYVLMSAGRCSPHARRPCAPALAWARAHARDAGPAAGLPGGVLYRLEA